MTKTTKDIQVNSFYSAYLEALYVFLSLEKIRRDAVDLTAKSKFEEKSSTLKNEAIDCLLDIIFEDLELDQKETM